MLSQSKPYFAWLLLLEVRGEVKFLNVTSCYFFGRCFALWWSTALNLWYRERVSIGKLPRTATLNFVITACSFWL